MIKDLFYFDIHGHKEKLLPSLLRIIEPGRIPKDVKLSGLTGTIVNGFNVCAIGDPNTFRKRKGNPFQTVLKQITDIKKTIEVSGGIVALSGEDFNAVGDFGRSVFVLGIEGGDFIGGDLRCLSAVYEEGVRVFQPMHYSKNQIGSISFGWGGRIVPPEEQTGLSPFGRELLAEAARLGMIVDLAHADERTTLDAAAQAEAPLICSHTGPRGLQDFPRYLSDDAIMAVAGTGGLIGLWPFLYKGRGVQDLDEFLMYAKYMADLIGIEHLALGTDINGVPGNMRGYENLNDAPVLIKTLSTGGFNDDEIRLIAGGNFLRLFDKITE